MAGGLVTHPSLHPGQAPAAATELHVRAFPRGTEYALHKKPPVMSRGLCICEWRRGPELFQGPSAGLVSCATKPPGELDIDSRAKPRHNVTAQPTKASMQHEH
jgi:hypothetical protein